MESIPINANEAQTRRLCEYRLYRECSAFTSFLVETLGFAVELVAFSLSQRRHVDARSFEMSWM